MKRYLILAATAGALSFGLSGGAMAAAGGQGLAAATVGGKSAMEEVARRRVCTVRRFRGRTIRDCRWVGRRGGWRRGRGGSGITIRVR